jgi:hypothetical protein
MHYEITEEEINHLLNIDGKVKGAVFKTDLHFIMETEGEEGVKKVEDKLKEMGQDFNFENDSTNLSSHPIGLRALSLIAISQVFDLNKEDIRIMGRTAPKFSLVLKFFMRYLVSTRTIINKANELWEEHYSVGRLEVLEVNEDDKFMRIALHDFSLHPIFCDYFTAYLEFIIKLGVGENVSGEEVKCTHHGDNYHEFLHRW